MEKVHSLVKSGGIGYSEGYIKSHITIGYMKRLDLIKALFFGTVSIRRSAAFSPEGKGENTDFSRLAI